MHAPDKVPEWFKTTWIKSLSDEDFSSFTFDKIESDGFEHRHLKNEGEAALYFSWKAYHADALLAELEQNK